MVLVGILAGAVIPESLRLEFAIPVLFIGLFVPHLTTRPTAAAAATGVLVTGLFAGVPNRGGMLIGGAAGVVVGTFLDRRMARLRSGEGEPA